MGRDNFHHEGWVGRRWVGRIFLTYIHATIIKKLPTTCNTHVTIALLVKSVSIFILIYWIDPPNFFHMLVIAAWISGFTQEADL